MKRFASMRVFALLLAVLLVLPILSACNKQLEENEIAVKWHMGVINSDLDKDAPCQILDGVEGYSYSDIITIPKAGTRLTFTDNNGDEAVDSTYADETIFVLSHWEEKDGAWVIDHPGDNYTGLDGRSGEIAEIVRGEYAKYSFVSTYDNEKVRLCYASGQTKKNTRKLEFAKVYLEETREQGTLTTSKTNIMKDLKVADFLETAKDTCWFPQLEGITMYTMGDSYFGGSSNGKQYVWPNLMAQKYGMDFANYGIGGSTIAHGGYVPMCERISEMKSGSPDIILLEGGRNDFSNNNIYIGNVSDEGTTTFCGAINSCIAQLQAKYPNALIIGITCWSVSATNNVTNETQQQYADAMLDVFAAHGLPCFDASDKQLSGVDMDRYSFREQYSQNTNDISHLNTDGMILVEPAFERFIAAEYQKFLDAKAG